MHRGARADRQSEAERRLEKAGYAVGGAVKHEDEADAKADKKRVKKAFGQHDKQLHGGKHTKLDLKSGGKVTGHAAHHHAGKKARGGSVDCEEPEAHAKGGAVGKKHGAINIIIHNPDQGGKQMAAQQGMQQGMRAGASLGARQAAQHMQAPPPSAPTGGLPTAPPGGGQGMAGPSPGGMGGRPPGAQLPRPPMPQRPGMGPGGAPFAKGGAVTPQEEHIKVRAHTRRPTGKSATTQAPAAAERAPGIGGREIA